MQVAQLLTESKFDALYHELTYQLISKAGFDEQLAQKYTTLIIEAIRKSESLKREYPHFNNEQFMSTRYTEAARASRISYAKNKAADCLTDIKTLDFTLEMANTSRNERELATLFWVEFCHAFILKLSQQTKNNWLMKAYPSLVKAVKEINGIH